MALYVKDVIETLSKLDPEEACVWQLWTKDDVVPSVNADQWLSICKYFDNYPISSESVGLTELVYDLLEKSCVKQQ